MNMGSPVSVEKENSEPCASTISPLENQSSARPVTKDKLSARPTFLELIKKSNAWDSDEISFLQRVSIRGTARAYATAQAMGWKVDRVLPFCPRD